MLKWIYIYDDVGSNVEYSSVIGDEKIVELYFGDEGDSHNDIGVGK